MSSKWKETLKRTSEGRSGKGGHSCPPQLRDYLDQHIPEWRTEVREKNIPPIQRAQAIVARYEARGCVLPRQLVDRSHCPERHQEFKDAVRLKDWKRALRVGKGGGGGKCDPEVMHFLDTHMVGWRSRVYSKQQQQQQQGCAYGDGENSININYDDEKIISVTLPGRGGNSNVIKGGDCGNQACGDGIRSSSSSSSSGSSSGSNSSDRSGDGEDATLFTQYTGVKRLIAGQGDCVGTDPKKARAEGSDGVMQTQAVPPPPATATDLETPHSPLALSSPASSSSSSALLSASIYRSHDDKEISAAAGLVAAHAARV